MKFPISSVAIHGSSVTYKPNISEPEFNPKPSMPFGWNGFPVCEWDKEHYAVIIPKHLIDNLKKQD